METDPMTVESLRMALVTLQKTGSSIFYLEKGDGLPVVFLSGLGAGHEYWASTLRYVSRRFRCIALDNRDVGQSGYCDQPYDIKSMAQDVIGLLNHLSVSRAHIVGQSMGGMIAQELAITQPLRVQSLVLCDTMTYCDPWFDATLSAFQVIREQVDGTPEFFEAVLPWMVSHRFLNDSQRATWLRWFFHQNPYPQLIGGFRRHLAAIRQHDTRASLDQIQCPALVLVGEDDTLIPQRYSEQLAELIPDARLQVLPGVGHAPPIEDPVQFNKCIDQYLRDQCIQSRAA